MSRSLVRQVIAAFGLLAVAGLAGAAEDTPPASIEKGRELFQSAGCFQCHTLADAGATGGYAPSFDFNPHLSKAMVQETVTNGRGDMPSFGGLLTDEEIAALADYIAAVAKPAAQGG